VDPYIVAAPEEPPTNFAVKDGGGFVEEDWPPLRREFWGECILAVERSAHETDQSCRNQHQKNRALNLRRDPVLLRPSQCRQLEESRARHGRIPNKGGTTLLSFLAVTSVPPCPARMKPTRLWSLPHLGSALFGVSQTCRVIHERGCCGVCPQFRR